MTIVAIDDDKDFLNSWANLLREDGHTVHTFFEIGIDWLPTVQNLKPDLALIDRKMKEVVGNIDGELSAIRLQEAGIPSVLVTRHCDDSDHIFEMLWSGRLAGWMSKENLIGSERLSCVRTFARTGRFPNGIATFSWASDEADRHATAWPFIAKELALANVDNDELCSLFRGLFSPFATKVQLKPLVKGKGGAAVVRAYVSSGEGSVIEDLVIKFGETAIIRSEAMRYDRFIGPLPDGVGAQLRLRYETETLMAIAYSFVGNSIQAGVPLLSSAGQALSWDRRRNAISRLFNTSLDPWFRIFRSSEKPSEVHPVRIVDYYTSENGLWEKNIALKDLKLPYRDLAPEFMIKQTENKWIFHLEEHEYRESSQAWETELPDPIAWLTFGKGRDFVFNRKCPSHGDLHSKNIFILPDDSPRLIDFGKTANGHIFRDFAALETSLRLNCLGINEQRNLALVEGLLCRVTTLGQFINYRSLLFKRAEQAQEVIRTLIDIRRAALDCCGISSGSDAVKQYMLAVLLHLLKYASGTADEAPKDEHTSVKHLRIWQAHYAASQIVESIERSA